MKMHKLVLVMAMCVIVVSARPKQDVGTVYYDNKNLGNYKFTFDLPDVDTYREETGVLKQVGDAQVQTIKGSYSYVSPEGQEITLNYEADENGFRPA